MQREDWPFSNRERMGDSLGHKRVCAFMREWLTDAILNSAQNLSEEAEGYVLGRGLPSRLATEMHVGVWQPPLESAPAEDFRKFGSQGEHFKGWLSIPLWSPRGSLLGVEFRKWDGEKRVRKYHLPTSKWNPVFGGLTPSALHKIWEGGDVWLVEGIFDLALSHAVEGKDVVLSTGGAMLTQRHVSFLKRFMLPTAAVHLAFDEDETGRRQATGFTDDKTGRWVPGVPARLERVGVRCQVRRYRGGKDPGEIWEHGGSEALRSSFSIHHE